MHLVALEREWELHVRREALEFLVVPVHFLALQVQLVVSVRAVVMVSTTEDMTASRTQRKTLEQQDKTDGR